MYLSVEKTIEYKSINESNSKTQKLLSTNKCRTIHSRSLVVRPFILKILRHYDNLEMNAVWCKFLQVSYIKASKEFIPVLNKRIFSLKDLMTSTKKRNNEMKYLLMFKNNLLRLKKKCEDSTINYFNYLPGKKIPLEIRSHIVSFISPTRIEWLSPEN